MLLLHVSVEWSGFPESLVATNACRCFEIIIELDCNYTARCRITLCGYLNLHIDGAIVKIIVGSLVNTVRCMVRVIVLELVRAVRFFVTTINNMLCKMLLVYYFTFLLLVTWDILLYFFFSKGIAIFFFNHQQHVLPNAACSLVHVSVANNLSRISAQN